MTAQPVVVDTNAALLPFTDGTDIEEALVGLVGLMEIHVPSSIAWELGRLARQGGRTGRAAKAAIALARRWNEAATDLPGDDGLLDVARRLNAVVVSNDRRVQVEARKAGLTVVASRGRGRLHVLGE